MSRTSDEKIVLLMMVKNEEHVVGRAIRSAANVVDHIIVVDTGSTDHTANVAFEAALEVGKELTYLVQDWHDFGTNRTMALNAAKQCAELQNYDFERTWFLLLDADDMIDCEAPGTLRNFLRNSAADAIELLNSSGNLRYPQIRLLRASTGFKWIGATHELLTCTDGRDARVECLRWVKYIIGDDSNRRLSGRKTVEDIKILEDSLAADPTNTRNLFYLGTSCWVLGRYEDALEHFSRYVEVYAKHGGSAEELYMVLVRAADCCVRTDDPESAAPLFLEAINNCPGRPEAYAGIATLYEAINKKVLAYMFAKAGATVDGSGYRLFVDPSMQRLCQEIRDRLAQGFLDEKNQKQKTE